MEHIKYNLGFGNYFLSEAKCGVLQPGQNSPQKVPFGLYAEQLSGTAFTAERHNNLRSWLYRIRPSVMHEEFSPYAHPTFYFEKTTTPPTQMRWQPMPISQACDFIDGIFTLAGNEVATIHLYTATRSMENRFFYNADGELLIVPQGGSLFFKTEFGLMDVSPGEIIVIPRGVKFQVMLQDKEVRGYICENKSTPFRLPELGPIGANGLANPRDFQIPHAHYENLNSECELIVKFNHHLWQTTLQHSPCDVVAWHGNYVPYKYNLGLFNTINSVSFDHPDPSIFTVLTSPSEKSGVANIDFVIFPPRWMVAENTFRPPYFHRNVMSEYMGLIFGTYDAKENGFLPGGGSLHNCMSAHGPDGDAFQKATTVELKPEYYANTLAFMFESQHIWQVTSQALSAHFRQKDYLQCWQNLKSNFVTE